MYLLTGLTTALHTAMAVVPYWIPILLLDTAKDYNGWPVRSMTR